jgi:hypothetical protein
MSREHLIRRYEHSYFQGVRLSVQNGEASVSYGTFLITHMATGAGWLWSA